MLHYHSRPDWVVLLGGSQADVIADMRTAVVSIDGSCNGAAATAGHAAAQAATAKESKWVPQAAAQGLRFFAFVIECYGRLGDGALAYLDWIASRLGGPVSDRNAFITQRIRAVSMKSVCDILLERVPMGANPLVSRLSYLPLG